MAEHDDDTLNDTDVATMEAPPADVEYRLYLSGDRSAVLLDHPDPLANMADTIVSILMDLQKLELPEAPAEPDLRRLVEAAATEGEPIVGVTLVTGQPPVPSRDGEIEWARDFFATGWVIDADNDSIDFWQRAENRCVQADDLLARMVPAKAGETGVDVYGNKIDVAKPAAVKLRAGKGARAEELDDGSTAVYAEINGRVCCVDDVLTVDDLLLLPEVSLATGNVEHTGSVMIDGDVRNGAKISVQGDIAVKGLVEQCELRCGGSLTVAGGIIGDPGQDFTVGGNLEARYIKEAVIDVHGDVTVTGEVDQCRIRATGTVDVSKGRISGGSITAYRGIRVGVAGAKGAGTTRLITGVDFTRERALAEQKAEIKRLERRMEILETILRHGAAMAKEQIRGLSVVVKDIMARRRDLKDTLDAARSRLSNLRKDADKKAVKKMVILNEVWSGTVVQIGEEWTKVTQTVEKPRLVELFKDKPTLLPLGEDNMPDF